MGKHASLPLHQFTSNPSVVLGLTLVHCDKAKMLDSVDCCGRNCVSRPQVGQRLTWRWRPRQTDRLRHVQGNESLAVAL